MVTLSELLTEVCNHMLFMFYAADLSVMVSMHVTIINGHIHMNKPAP